MGKTRNIFIVIVLNIFLTLFVSILMEYATLSERFLNLERNVSSALVAALDASTMSEEMFSDALNNRLLSYGSVDEDTNNDGVDDTFFNSSSRTLAYDYTSDKWFHVNPYIYSMYYDTVHVYPTLLDYNGYEASNETADVYKWLYGDIGSSYGNSNLSWANTNKAYSTDLANLGIGTSRTPNANFANFYQNIGCKIKSYGYVKKQTGSGGFEIVLARYNTLDNMGLDFSGCSLAGVDKSLTGVNSQFTSDNFVSVTHRGKYANGQFSNYYLTPNSLGVTYIPQEVLEPTFKTTLESIVRMQVMSETGNAAQATGCISTNMYDIANNTHKTHTADQNSFIINDGQVEYDLSQIDSKIEYFLVDFHDSNNRNIVGNMLGVEAISETDNGTSLEMVMDKAVDRVKQTNTNMFYKYSNRYDGKVNNSNSQNVTTSDFGKRIVARVTIRVKVHVPYQSGILQWAWDYARNDASTTGDVHRNAGNMAGVTDAHYDIPVWDTDTGKVLYDESGMWYQVVKYFTISN